MLLPEEFRVKKPSVRLLANLAGVLVMPALFLSYARMVWASFLLCFSIASLLVNAPAALLRPVEIRVAPLKGINL